ncbi:fibronectin type III domain-containing protein [Galbibacter sp. BG1]|uniref:fibronectin type III domain-containing protein n=1 Tax=Galbibacter sp. BG1 TaxID=1170699 RepID=UPI0015C09064|nr:PA14 domain-containing protein [Galbibacter sp. BG1]QLE02216.1 fibronectin type III domain-containing protein [Galbibacter sp. BG1]
MKFKYFFTLFLTLISVWAVRSQWEDLNPGGGGQIQDVVCDPNIPGRLYLSSDMEGVYRSDDNGESWHYASEGLVHSRAFITTVDPTNSNRIYVGTMYGLSISNNAGQSYFFAPETADNSINAIAIDPFDSNHIIAGAGWKDDYDFWTWGIGRVASSGPGHYFESWDYGASWTEVTYNNITDNYFNIYSIVFDKTSQGTIYIAGDQGLWKTTNAGTNWNLIPGPTQYKCRGIDLSPQGDVIYATYATDNGDYFNVGSGSKIYASRTSSISWNDITSGLTYTSQMWYPEVDDRSTGNTHNLLVAYRNARSGLWQCTIDWNGNSISSYNWENIWNEQDNFDPGWDTWYPNPNVRWAHYSPTTWDKAIWTTGNQTLFSGTPNGTEWHFENKYCEPTNIITPATGEPTYHSKGFASTFTFDGSAYANYAIQSQGDNGIQESWDYGYSWNNHSVREFNRHNHADAVDFAMVDGVPTVVVAAAQGWGGVNLSGHTIMTKKLTNLDPTDTWQARNGNLPNNYNVKALRVSPHNQKSVLMGIYGSGIWWIEDIKDFINGGSAQKIADKDTDNIAGANSIAFHPSNPNIIYVASNIFENSPTTNQKQHLFKGTRSGNSWSWEQINDGIGWGASITAWDYNNKTYLVYSGQEKDPGTGAYDSNMSVQISTDDGATWNTILNKETTLPLKNHSWYDYISDRYKFNYGGVAGIDNQIILGCYHHEFGKPYGAFRGIIESDNSVTWENWTDNIDFPGFTKAQIKNIEGKNYYYGSTAGTGLWRREITPVGGSSITPPSNLQAENSGSGIDLSWSDNSSNESGYRIERGSDGKGFSVLKTVAANTTTYTDEGFCPGKNFNYRVRTVSGSSVSNPSNSVTITSSSPGLPEGSANGLIVEYFDNIDFTNLVATGIEEPINFDWKRIAPNNCMDVDTWSARWTGEVVAPTTGTYTFEATADDAVSVWINGELIIEQTLEDPNDPVSGTVAMTANTKYAIKIEYAEDGWDANLVLKWAANDEALTIVPASALSSNGIAPQDPPASPSSLIAAAFSENQIDLTWNDNSTNENGFSIQQLTDGNWEALATVSANVSSYSATNLEADKSYSFRVRATNSGGNSNWSNVASATTDPLPSDPPNAPSNLTTSTVSSSSISLTWTDNSNDENGFKVERKIGSETFSEVAMVNSNTSSFLDTGLNEETTYYYRVRSYNSNGNSAYTATKSGTTGSGNDNGCPNPNLVLNGEFNNELNNWNFYHNTSGNPMATVVNNANLSGSNAVKVTINSGATGTNDSDIQLFTNTGSLESGKTYQITFQAKATANRSMRVGVLNNVSPWNNYSSDIVNLTATSQTFGPLEFSMSETTSNARLDFFLGGNSNNVFIDNVSIKEKCNGSTNIPVTAVSISGCTSSLTTNNTMDLSANVSPSNASNKNVIWSSSNNSVATVNSSGTVTANAVGSSTITVTTAEGNKTATCKVTVSNDGGSSTAYRYLRLTGLGTVGNAVTIQQIHWMENGNSYPNPKLTWGTKAKATSSTNGQDDFAAFDNTNGGWNIGTSFPEWITIDLGIGNEINPDKIRIKANASDRGFSSFECHGSNDNSNWTLLHSESGLTPADYPSTWGTFPFSGTSSKSTNANAEVLQLNDTDTTFSMYPNPIEAGEVLSINTETNDSFEIAIFNTSGSKILERKFDRKSGTSIEVPLSSTLASGIYFIIYISETKKVTKKIFIK